MSPRKFVYCACMAIVEPRTLPALILATVIKLLFPAAFSWWWVGVPMIAYLLAAVILIVWYFKEIAEAIES